MPAFCCHYEEMIILCILDLFQVVTSSKNSRTVGVLHCMHFPVPPAKLNGRTWFRIMPQEVSDRKELTPRKRMLKGKINGFRHKITWYQRPEKSLAEVSNNPNRNNHVRCIWIAALPQKWSRKYSPYLACFQQWFQKGCSEETDGFL